MDTPFWSDPGWRAQAGLLWSIALSHALVAFIPAYGLVMLAHVLDYLPSLPSSTATLSLSTFNWLVGAPVLQTALFAFGLRWLAKTRAHTRLSLTALALLWGAIASRYGYWGPEMAWSCGVFIQCYQKYSRRHVQLGTILAVTAHALVNVFAFATGAWREPFVPFQPL